MIERNEIRVLTPVTLGSYFIDRGRERGATYEYIQLFEKFVKQRYGKDARRLKITIIPVRRDQLLPFLVDGYGDIVATNYWITPRRLRLVDFSKPVMDDGREFLVTGPASPEVEDLEDLSGKEVVVRAESSYFEHLEEINTRFRSEGRPEIRISEIDPRLEDEDILEMVHAGLLPMTVAEDFRARLWGRVFDQLKVREDIVIESDGKTAFAIRKQSPQLKALLDDFVELHDARARVPADIVRRNRDRTDWVQPALRREPFQRLESVASLFQKYGERYDFDWLLLASFALQESGLRQGARSPRGAVGIMQVLPSTAADAAVKISNIDVLENNIHAGTKYLSVLRDRYFADPSLDPFERMLFTMAAYNAGPNRIVRLRQAAAERDLDPNQWFNNVELVVAAKVGREPVTYVGNIYKYYVAYKRTFAELEQRRAVRATGE